MVLLGCGVNVLQNEPYEESDKCVQTSFICQYKVAKAIEGILAQIGAEKGHLGWDQYKT